MAVDDAQWADEPSAGFVRHVATRLERLPLLLVIATRPRGLLSELTVEPSALTLRPAELSADAVRGWISDAFDQEADADFAAACRQATGGNPFLVSELVREAGREGLHPRREAVDRLRSVSPRGVVTAVLLRLAGLPPDASAFARAVAVLGETEPALTARLAGLSPHRAVLMAGHLAHAGVLTAAERPGFVHPLVRTALYEDIPPAERRLAHARAARVLHDAGARPEHVAAQLVLASPVGERWASDALLAGAADAAASGAPEVAARFLTRELEEAAPEDRFEVLLALGRVEVLAGQPQALTHLRAAGRAARTPVQRVRATVSLGRVLRYAGDGGEAVELLEAAAVGLGDADADLAALVQRELLAASTVSYGARRRLADSTRRWWEAATRPPRSFLDRFLHAAQAVESANRGDDVATTLELADAAVAQDLGADHAARHLRLLACYAFLLCDRFDRADRQLDELDRIAKARGGAEMLATVASQRAVVARRRGDLLTAQAEGLAALELVADLGAPPAFLHTGAAALTWVATDREEAPHPLAAAVRDDGDSLFSRHLAFARAGQHLVEGRFEDAIAGMLALGERELGIGWVGPAQFAWRSEAALALHALRRTGEARRLAADEVRLARACRAPRALGIALRASALVGDVDRVEGLREAVAVLAASAAELEHGRALVDLGAALRRGRRPTDARAPLQQGYELATRSGATRLARHAHDELLAAGARPRRSASRGPAALTPSELRVAKLAAQALRNRDIAQSLYVTEKTVETHLGHAYAKLGVSSRRELSAALAAES